MAAIENTLSEFNAWTFHGQSKFVSQQYVSPTTMLSTDDRTATGNIRTSTIELTPPDKLNVVSVLTLPVQAMRFARARLPGTSIMARAQMSATGVVENSQRRDCRGGPTD